jgi:hypothetical protein
MSYGCMPMAWGWRMGVAIGFAAGLRGECRANLRLVRLRASVATLLMVLMLSGCSGQALERAEHCWGSGGESAGIFGFLCAVYAYTGWEWIIGVVFLIGVPFLFIRAKNEIEESKKSRAPQDADQNDADASSRGQPGALAPKQPSPSPNATPPAGTRQDPLAASRSTTPPRSAPGQTNRMVDGEQPDAPATQKAAPLAAPSAVPPPTRTDPTLEQPTTTTRWIICSRCSYRFAVGRVTTVSCPNCTKQLRVKPGNG